MELVNGGTSKWKVASTTKRAGSPVAELTVFGSDKIKLNQAASIATGIASGDYLTFLMDAECDVIQVKFNEDSKTSVDAKGNEVTYAICKGLPMLDAKGNAVMSREKDGKASERFQGSKMSAVGGHAGFGIINGSDSKNCRPLGGNDDNNVVYEIDVEAAFEMEAVNFYPGAGDDLTIALDGQVVKVFPIKFNRFEDKIERGAKA